MSVSILQGHVLDRLAELPDESIHCAITSPPYYGLRSYGTPPLIWGGDAECDHRWSTHERKGMTGGTASDKVKIKGSENFQAFGSSEYETCQHCNAWRGHLGLEPTPKQYVEHMVQIFRELRRVLRDDGTFWLNIGDSYNAHPGQRKTTDKVGAKQETNGGSNTIGSRYVAGCKPKDLIGIPWMLAFALRADGWYLRSEIIWSKQAPMPESVRDRPTCAHETIFLLAKSDRYFYDADAVKEPVEALKGNAKSFRGGGAYTQGQSFDNHSAAQRQTHGNKANETLDRNLRNVWHLNPEPFGDAHFATFPTKIPERAIMAGTSEKGCCSACGTPWKRGYEMEEVEQDGLLALIGAAETKSVKKPAWLPGCDCNANIVPCTVLDPFNGAGTTGLVAARLLRNYIGIELNPEYVAMSERRINKRAGLLLEAV